MIWEEEEVAALLPPLIDKYGYSEYGARDRRIKYP
jgi:hypothetical protein